MADSCSNSSSSSAPKPKLLRRAANLLTSNGRPVVEELVFEPTPQPLRSRQNRLSSSIRRKFKDVSMNLTRSKSTSVVTLKSMNGHEVLKRKGHSHSFSDAQHGFRPTLIHPHTLPESSSMASSSPSPVQPAPEPPVPESMTVPELLQIGTPLTKVSSTSKHKKLVFRIDPDQGQISWDSKSHKIIPIEAIKELRCGADARYDREQFQLSPEYEDRWITIIYILDGEYKALHLIAPTKDVYNMWQITLHKLYAIRQELMAGLGNLEMRQTLWEKHYWKSSDEERDQKLEFSEVEKLCKRLNINTNSENLLRLFNQADVRKRNYLDFQDFRRFVKLLKARPEVDRLYKQIKAKSKDVFDYDAFEMFMHDKQLTTLTRPEIQALFAKYTRPSETPESPIQSPSAAPSSETSSLTPVDPTAVIMTPDAFASFLLSNDNSALIDSNRNIWQDMTRPLSEYYVSSSHNTYLVGHQLVGVSTTEGYIRALLHSCRSVELDIYDGDKEPMIFHGKTLTSKVSLREVCEAIKKYGFVSSPYPVIISAEIHCGIPQQEQMVDIMISVFGDALVQAPVDARPIITVLPSPEELKGRILLKAKNLLISRTQSRPPGDSGVVEVSASSASDSDMMHEVKEEWDYAKKREAEAVKEIRGIMERVRGRGKSNPPVNGGPRSSEAGKTKPKMSFALVALLVYTVGVKCRGINKKEEYAPEHMFSLSETTANKMLKTNMIDLIKHARTHMVRIYPKGLRLNSTNYEPHRYWSGGAQLVALNWQTFDLGYMINHAMFQRNGRAGYVLKPPALRLNQKELLGKRTDHFLDVTVISAQQLPQPKDSSWRDILDRSMIDPYVEVSVHVPDWTVAPDGTHVGLTADVEGPPSATAACTHTYRTSVVKNNGFNPVWEEKLRIPFTCVGDMKDLIFVRFTVKQGDKDDDEPLAVFCASLGSLQSGYRHLPLHDAQLSQYLFATLFVRIHIHDIL